MSDQFWLSEEQVARIKPYFSLSHGVPRVDDRKSETNQGRIRWVSAASLLKHLTDS